MTDTNQEKITGAENIVWDLSVLYHGVDDPAIEKDIQKVATLADEFAATYKGKVASLDAAGLLKALKAVESIYDITYRLGSYASLLFSTTLPIPKAALYSKRQLNLAPLSARK